MATVPAPTEAPTESQRGLRITFPDSLPVSARRDEIEAALAAHQVIIVCGETGSGKTTQLPKIALAMGRGKCNAKPGQRSRLIGHTQPRRIAASSVAKRIAEELQTPLGEVVGYKVRFQDRLSKNASVKLMTDGILLAETQTDPLLEAYDTLIIDEAHERSLNIDFLLGYLREVLPRRPDLKVIVTSATIDADRFANHFASSKGPAPIVLVSGRTYPVEVRYRPFEERKDRDLNDAIADGVDELWRVPHPAPGRPKLDEAPSGGSVDAQRGAWGSYSEQGDILVFLPGEREIREAADHLRQHLSHSPLTRGAEVLPLFARLSQAEQDRVFDNHHGRRIVLATNVAETSLTVPGIRYVIDAGTARVKRYSYRNKVEQLLVEPVSQAAANQRAGRCGRVANGICIRLYDEADFNGRPKFTDPEVLRSSLAGVILRMKSLHLGDVERFPFLEAPRPKAIADGYQLLNELGAVDDANELTGMGRELAKLPLDPRVARMIVEARSRHALPEVLVIAAAMSVQDVRDRPLEFQAQADQAHAKFDDDKSEFNGYLRLWQWLDQAKGGHGTDHKLSNRQYENLLKANYISPRRVREWRDIHSQLLTVAAEHGWLPHPARAASAKAQGRSAIQAAPQRTAGQVRTTSPTPPPDTPSTAAPREPASAFTATHEQLHLSLLAGLLGNVGCKLDDEDVYLGARGIKFYRHPGAHLKKKPGRWIVVAELVETTRLFGRGIANIEPQWIEQAGGHLLRKQLLDPHWEKKAAEVVALERATLYGLVVYNGRRVNFGRHDPVRAREVFIREALVGGEWELERERRLPFIAANAKLTRQIEDLEHKSRRQDVLVDDELIYAFYDRHLPADIYSGIALERWVKEQLAANKDAKPLVMTREALMRHDAASVTRQAFPHHLRLGGVDCKLTYRHEPGHARDGVTADVPLFALNQVSEAACEWLVPGMLADKILALLKSLHQRPRSRFVPLPESSKRLAEVLLAQQAEQVNLGLLDALLKQVRDETSLDVKRTDFKLEQLKPHHFLNLRVVDEHGRQLGMGRHLAALKSELGQEARGAFQALAALRSRDAAAPPAAASASEENRPTAPVGIENPAIKSGVNAPKPATAQAPSKPSSAASTEQRHTTWDFGELPELMEVSNGKQTLIGFPALIDQGDAVTLQVFDEPELAAARHRAGLSRLFALQIKDALKYLEKSIPDLQAMGVHYMNVGKTEGAGGSSGKGGTVDELRRQIIATALDRAFLIDPLPVNAAQFNDRLAQGRQRLTLIANEVARLAGQILIEHTAAQRKLKDNRNYPPAAAAVADAAAQLQRLMPVHFLATTDWAALQHLPRYLKAITLRFDKLRADPARDTAKTAELKPLEQRYWRLVADRKGMQDEAMLAFRWQLEELRVSLFAQELRTPQPVSVKRLEKGWGQLVG